MKTKRKHTATSSRSANDSSAINDESAQQFLSTVTHDLKNPLGAIFGYADILLDTAIGQGLSEKQREVIARIRSTSARSIELIRNFQHLSEMRELGLLQSPVLAVSDLNYAIQQVVESTWRDENTAPLLQMDLSPEEIPVKIDRIQADRVFSNLFTNALKYTPKDGQISISTWKAAGFGWLKISNTGAPIPTEDIARIFERAVRGRNSKGIPGTGLGLHIVKLIVESIEGKISVNSDTSGTSFTVSIPLSDRAE